MRGVDLLRRYWPSYSAKTIAPAQRIEPAIKRTTRDLASPRSTDGCTRRWREEGASDSLCGQEPLCQEDPHEFAAKRARWHESVDGGRHWSQANTSGHFESCGASSGLRQRWPGQRKRGRRGFPPLSWYRMPESRRAFGEVRLSTVVTAGSGPLRWIAAGSRVRMRVHRQPKRSGLRRSELTAKRDVSSFSQCRRIDRFTLLGPGGRDPGEAHFE